MRIGLRNGVFLLVMISLFGLSSLTVGVSDAGAEIVIIANSSVPQDSIKKKELKDIFLGNTIKWGDKSKINIVVQKKGDAHNEFVKKITNKSASQFQNYWKKMVFTGKGSAPKSFEKAADLIAYVAETEGAISYIATGAQPEGVKVIQLQE